MCTIALKQDSTGDGRCIKPNPESQPGSLTPNYVLEQLRAGGVLEAVRIACAGFPTRKAFRPFAMRYNILLASGRGAYRHLDPETLQEGEAADISRKVLQAVKIMGWQMGKTRVFLRAGQLAQLEVETGLASCVSCRVLDTPYHACPACSKGMGCNTLCSKGRDSHGAILELSGCSRVDACLLAKQKVHKVGHW